VIKKNKKKLIFIQLNEINFELLKNYSNKYNFKFFNSQFLEKLVNTKSENEYSLLEPWIQWVSIYTGLEAKKHKIFRLGDGENSNHIHFYNLIEEKGYSIGAISPMNFKNNLKNSLYFIPDPWSQSDPDSNLFSKLITSTIRKFVNENSSKEKTFKDYFKLMFIFLINFRFKNIKLLFKLIFNISNHWNKALLFEYLLNNLHLNNIEKYRPDFTSIFFNSGAHIQHHYYFNSIFLNKIKNPSWYIDKKHDPIFDMLKFYDEIIFEYQKNKDYDLVIATGLRQIPYDRIKYYYRLKNHNEFLKKISVKFKGIVPKMSRDFIVFFDDKESTNKAEKIFNQINELNSMKIFYTDKRNNSIFVTLTINDQISDKYEIMVNKDNKINLNNYVNFIAIKNGMHDQKGYFYSNCEHLNLKNNEHVKNIHNVINDYF